MIKGIILAGGQGTRLYPATKVTSKQLLPVYDKPMIYYPLSVLMLAEIRDIMIISTPHDLDRFKTLLQDGRQWGIKISYAVQDEPKGLAEAFLIAESFIGNSRCALVLGDNIFYGNEITSLIRKAARKQKGATIFAYRVQNPQHYGVVVFDEKKKITKLVEKPKELISRYAVPGLYFYDNQVVGFAKNLKPSARGELEIIDIAQAYLDKGELEVQLLGRGLAWFDTGTFETLLASARFIETVQLRQGIKIACLEEIAFKLGYIGKSDLMAHAEQLKHNDYGQYLLDILEEKNLGFT